MIKFLLGMLLISGVIVAGAYKLPIMAALYLVPIFVLAKLSEDRATFRSLALAFVRKNNHLSAKQAILVLCTNTFAQLIIVSIFYTISYGVSSMISDTSPPISPLMPVGLSALAVILMLTFSSMSAHGSQQKDSPVTALMDQWVAMGMQDVIMPAEIFKLARAMVDYSDQQELAIFLEQGYEIADHHFQRRVFFTYLRFSGGENLHIQNPAAYIREGLVSEHNWVRYDAVWAYMTLKIKDDAIDAQLQEIAAAHPVEPGEKYNSSDAETAFYRKVYEALEY